MTYSAEVRATYGLPPRVSGSKLYGVYRSMLSRCQNENDRSYPNYGGRGITVADEWKDNFPQFSQWARSHGYCVGLALMRVNDTAHFSKDNCIWATPAQQRRNARNYRMYTAGTHTLSLSDWAKFLRCSTSSLRYRLFVKGMTMEEAIPEVLGPLRKVEKKWKCPRPVEGKTLAQWSWELGYSKYYIPHLARRHGSYAGIPPKKGYVTPFSAATGPRHIILLEGFTMSQTRGVA